MTDETKSDEPKPEETKTKVAVACQGGGIHASFSVGVLTEILKHIDEQKKPKDIEDRKRYELVGLSGTSAGALCALMVWYGLAPKKGGACSVGEAIKGLNSFWESFAATTRAEKLVNRLAYSAFMAQEYETPVLGLNAPVLSLNPGGLISKAICAALPLLRVRQQYFDLKELLAKACPEFESIKWDNLQTRLLVGASEVVNGIETTFDSDRNMLNQGCRHTKANAPVTKRWRERLPLSLGAVAASGTWPQFLPAKEIDDRYYWDGLYSQNPPIREFLAGVFPEYVPDEIWVVRINPQQWAELPQSNAEIIDRENELIGNLSLNKELDFILTVNDWIDEFGGGFAQKYKHVTVRTIKMKEQTADKLRYSSKFDRSWDFMDQLRKEGEAVAREWLRHWPDVGRYPEDAGYWPRRRVY
jgi:NTE family protein